MQPPTNLMANQYSPSSTVPRVANSKLQPQNNLMANHQYAPSSTIPRQQQLDPEPLTRPYHQAKAQTPVQPTMLLDRNESPNSGNSRRQRKQEVINRDPYNAPVPNYEHKSNYGYADGPLQQRGYKPQVQPKLSQKDRSEDSEPICVLKIELDGEHIEEIKVFENDDPSEIVQKFGDDFNLS